MAPVFHTPPNNPGGDAKGPSCPPPFDSGGDAPHDAPFAGRDSSPVDVDGGVQRHPNFLQGRIEDFDFSHNPKVLMLARMVPLLAGPTLVSLPAMARFVSLPPALTLTGTVPGSKITTPCFTDRFHVARAKNTSKFDAAGLAEENYHIKSRNTASRS